MIIHKLTTKQKHTFSNAQIHQLRKAILAGRKAEAKLLRELDRIDDLANYDRSAQDDRWLTTQWNKLDRAVD